MKNKGFFVLFGDGKALIEFCYLKNLIQGLNLVCEKGSPGETYFISDERSYAFSEVIREMARQLDKKILLLKIPYPLAWGLGWACEAIAKVFPFYPFFVKSTGRPIFSRNTLKWAAKSAVFCDITKSKKLLGYKPAYSLFEGIHETVAWYRANGWI